ncbi:Lar family restriction alleviation protein [Pseudomonas sp. DrBHI1]|uniref:Lar family restriction alleviation protein n=1 Tax=Pseudomonas sp. DrBHI1 TaxID=2006091 RepID=UPI001303DBA3|nr:Lar family restriction alleviation protein [Pseudomonas sp. DrBHI1]
MPTENRSSNTEMVSELLPCPFCGQQDFLIERLDSDASVVICQGLTGPHEACLARGPVGVAQDEGEEQPGRDKAVELWNARAEQHQGEPAAYQFQGRDGKWYGFTNERHYQNTLADGTWPIRPLYTHPAPADQQEPVARLRCYQSAIGPKVEVIKFTEQAFKPGRELDVYTHADPGEVERLQLEIEKLRLSLTLNDDALIQDGFVRIENRALRSRIDEQNELLREIKNARDWNGSYRALEKRIDAALSASAEPSAPAERDERADCENCDDTGLGPCTVCAALERKP